MRNAGPCFKCKCEILIPDALYEAADRARGQIVFYCAYGHGQCFSEGESEETKLRRERDRLKQDAARLTDEIAAQKKRADEAERRATKTRKRANAGVCQCCNRTFLNMQRHMKTKHPNVVPLEAKSA